MDFEHILTIVDKRGHRKSLENWECTYMVRIGHHGSASGVPMQKDEWLVVEGSMLEIIN